MSTFDRNWRELQLETLVDLSLTIGRVRSEDELVEVLLHRAVGTLDAGSGLVVTFRPGGQEATARALGLPPTFEPLRRHFPPELLDELSQGGFVRAHREANEPPHELLAAPLREGRELLGVVVLGDKETRVGRVPFSDSDARFLLSLSSMIATAVATSRRVAAIERDRQRLAEENRELRDTARREGFIGESSAVREMLETVRRVAPTGANVMLRGESGVGKERVARLLHSFSDRSTGPFVPLNCAALPESLLEAELFGIEEGVATGVQRRLGKIELANGGLLFLDEVGDLSLALQAKLLRMVQEREFERLGGRERIPVSLHLVTATNRDLEAMISDGQFREDLYYRLRVVVVNVAPLRERRSDIPLLARHFLEIYGEQFGRPGLKLSHEALGALMSFPFPGNVRELENVLQSAIALAPGDIITEDDLRLQTGPVAGPTTDVTMSLDELEQLHIDRVLDAVDGNRTAAARILGIDRSTLYRKMQRNATVDAFRDEVNKSNQPN
ncbi:MAG: sigma-54-dependent Fis family transcriptional regulator [Thermoanaerobaculales bacterium]|jgi:Nif-specific regulatory protein|nr:sigma-54-dependent Fis family transcriptional regulator [Thermoanaerobaculales bacterium]